jgi:hypothetical protein
LPLEKSDTCPAAERKPRALAELEKSGRKFIGQYSLAALNPGVAGTSLDLTTFIRDGGKRANWHCGPGCRPIGGHPGVSG